MSRGGERSLVDRGATLASFVECAGIGVRLDPPMRSLCGLEIKPGVEPPGSGNSLGDNCSPADFPATSCFTFSRIAFWVTDHCKNQMFKLLLSQQKKSNGGFAGSFNMPVI